MGKYLALVLAFAAFVAVQDLSYAAALDMSFDAADAYGLYDAKNKRPFCNAFTGCGKKRSDPAMVNENALSSEAAILAEKMLSDIQQYELLQNRLQGLSRAQSRGDGRRFGFFPEYFRKKRDVEQLEAGNEQ